MFEACSQIFFLTSYAISYPIVEEILLSVPGLQGYSLPAMKIISVQKQRHILLTKSLVPEICVIHQSCIYQKQKRQTYYFSLAICLRNLCRDINRLLKQTSSHRSSNKITLLCIKCNIESRTLFIISPSQPSTKRDAAS